MILKLTRYRCCHCEEQKKVIQFERGDHFVFICQECAKAFVAAFEADAEFSARVARGDKGAWEVIAKPLELPR